MPKVSVIIPIYGVEKYIRRCAESLFSQTLDDIEFIFIDDCTKDRSMEELRVEIEKNSSRFVEMKWKVRTERMPTNSGLPAVRRHGTTLCTGDYVIHCDSDDWVSPDMYRLLYERAKHDDLDIVYCDYFRSDGEKHIPVSQKKQMPLMQGPLWNRLVKRCLYTDHTILFPKANKAEDGVIMTQLSYYANKVGYVGIPLYYYFINNTSITGNKTKENALKCFRDECENVELRTKFLKSQHSEEDYAFDIMMWKYLARRNLIPLLKYKEFYLLWKNTYPEINKEYLLSPNISIIEKLRFVGRICRVIR